MKKQRFFLFYLLASLFLAQGILDCGCLYAAVDQAPKPMAMESGMPCHGGTHQDAPAKKDCCSACYLAKYALFPHSIEIQSLQDGGSVFVSGPSFSGFTGFLSEAPGLSQGLSASTSLHARSVPFSASDLLASIRLLI